MQTFDLEDEPVYEALSYTWGCPYGTPNFELEDSSASESFNAQFLNEIGFPINCDGCILYVTPNLYAALHHIRHQFITPSWGVRTDLVVSPRPCGSMRFVLPRATWPSVAPKSR